MIFKPITDLINKLIELAQERNTLALGSFSELRDIHKLLHEMETDVDKQTVLLQDIAAALIPPPSVPARLVLTLGPQVQK